MSTLGSRPTPVRARARIRWITGARIALAVTAAAAGSPGFSEASDPAQVALPGPSDAAWERVELPRVDRPTRWEPFEADGRQGWRATSACGASALVLRLERVEPPIDLDATPRLAWEWRVESLVGDGDPRERSGDDFAARVYVTFPYDESRGSWIDRLRRRLVERLVGAPLPGHALVYVWADHEPEGASWLGPRSGRTRIIVQQSGATGTWQLERVDVAAHVRRWFGPRSHGPSAIALLTDADDTCQETTAFYASFRFEAGPASREDAQGSRTPSRCSAPEAAPVAAAGDCRRQAAGDAARTPPRAQKR